MAQNAKWSKENFMRNQIHIHAWQASFVVFKSEFSLSSVKCTRVKNLQPCWQHDPYFAWKHSNRNATFMFSCSSYKKPRNSLSIHTRDELSAIQWRCINCIGYSAFICIRMIVFDEFGRIREVEIVAYLKLLWQHSSWGMEKNWTPSK